MHSGPEDTFPNGFSHSHVTLPPPRAQLKLNVFKDVLDVFQLIRVINKKTKIDNYTFKTSRKLYVQNNTYYPQNVTSGSNTHTTCLKLYIQTYSSKYYLSALVCSLGQNQVQDKQFPFQCVQQAQLTGKHRNNNKPMALRITSNCKRNRERERTPSMSMHLKCGFQSTDIAAVTGRGIAATVCRCCTLPLLHLPAMSLPPHLLKPHCRRALTLSTRSHVHTLHRRRH